MKQKPKSISNFYDDKYHDYRHPAPETLLEKLFIRLRRFEVHRNEAAIALLSPSVRFLDIGAGYGDLLTKAHQKGFKQLYGIDISSIVIRHCRKHLKKSGIKTELSVQNIDEGTNFKPNFFDAITMIAVFEHVFSPHQVLVEVNRILKKKGQLVIEVPNVVFLPRRLSFLCGILPKTSDEPIYRDGHLQFFTQDSLRGLLQEHGFDVVYQGSSGIFSNLRNIWPSLLGANIIIKAVKG